MLSRLIAILIAGPRWSSCLLLALLLPGAIGAQHIVAIGDATAELTGPWRFHTGDDPAWARPDFDDSAWSTMDLTPPQGSRDPYLGSSGFVPGWTARGYPGYSGFAWYRVRVDVNESAEGGLALRMPNNVDDAYQVYANGELIGQFGRFSQTRAMNYISQPRAFPLPSDVGKGPLTLAIRMWMDPHTLLVEYAAGGMHGPPVMGQAPVVMAMHRLDWDVVDQVAGSGFPEATLLLLAMAVAFSLFAMDRSESAYAWLGVNCVVMLLVVGAGAVSLYTTWIPAMPAVFLRDVILLPLQVVFWIVFWASWFRLSGRAWLLRVVWALVALQAVGTALERAPLYGRLVPIHALTWISPAVLTLKLMLAAVLIWIAYCGIEKDRTQGLLALPAVILTGVAQYQYELALFHAPILFSVWGYMVSVNQIATGLSLIIITVLLLRRFIYAQRMREQWKLEIEQARHIQQILIPGTEHSIPGFALQSDYRPSQQVGGDFFQILPGEDGSVLAIVGDVSGKGLRAAMLVSLIVGVVRTMARFSRDPVELLRGLNERLYERLKNQFVTCVALHIAPDGKTTMANAGHLPPFWNGRELELTGSIPLGIIKDAPIEQSELVLEPGDRIILLTDGIVEAQNKQHELFGFGRMGALALEDASPAEIANAAQEFGQDDDITVVRIQRIGTGAGARTRGEEMKEPVAGAAGMS